jgi:hypothetical protein
MRMRMLMRDSTQLLSILMGSRHGLRSPKAISELMDRSRVGGLNRATATIGEEEGESGALRFEQRSIRFRRDRTVIV